MAEGTREPVSRAFDVLVHMVERSEGPTSARRLAGELGMSSTTAQRALAALVAAGMVVSDSETQLYAPGPGLHRLARTAAGKHGLVDIATPYLRALSAETGETSQLGQYEPTNHAMMFVDQVPGSRPLRYVVPMNAWVPLYVGASGLAMLAFLPDAVQDVVIRRATEEGGLVESALRDRLKPIREQGFALTRGQRLPGAVGIAAPIRGVESRVLGDVVLTVPEVQFEDNRGAEYATLVTRCARDISHALGAPPETADHFSNADEETV